MRRFTSPLSFSLTAIFAALSLAGCATTKLTPEQEKARKEDMVYIPPTTGQLSGRWVSRSDAGAPGIAPVSGVSSNSVKTMQTEGIKNSPTSAAVSQGGGGH